MRINKRAGHVQDWITQQWVKATGRRIDPLHHQWLVGPIGDTDIIKDKFFRDIAEKENLDIVENKADSGLLESFDSLELTEAEKQLIHPEITVGDNQKEKSRPHKS